MDNQTLRDAFATLSTPLIADACLRLDIPMRAAPPGIRAITTGTRLAGPALPARHVGSVDVFIDALHEADSGDVLLVDNGGRNDEGCVGDLVVMEALVQKAAGIVIWGMHRDTPEIASIGLPLFSYGRNPMGPARLDDSLGREFAQIGPHQVTRDDAVLADDDGVIFVPVARLPELIQTAKKIHQTERDQAAGLLRGQSLYEQFQFADYLAKRRNDPAYTFRQHLRAIGGAIEE